MDAQPGDAIRLSRILSACADAAQDVPGAVEAVLAGLVSEARAEGGYANLLDADSARRVLVFAVARRAGPPDIIRWSGSHELPAGCSLTPRPRRGSAAIHPFRPCAACPDLSAVAAGWGEELVEVVLPVAEGGSSSVAMHLLYRRERVPPPPGLAVLTLAGLHIGQIIRSVHRRGMVRALMTVGDALSTLAPPEDVLRRGLVAAMGVLQVEAGAIFLWNAGRGVLRMAMHRGYDPEAFREIEEFAPGVGIPGLVFDAGAPVVTRDLPADARYLRQSVKRLGYRCLACVPIRTHAQVLGTLEVTTRRRRAFSDDEVELLVAVGRLLGIALEQARLHEESLGQALRMEELYDTMLTAMAEAVDSRHPDTASHSDRTALLTTWLAARLGMKEATEAIWVRWGCRLHDIGKIGVPDSMLLKPGPLTPAEWEIVRRHPEVGYRILRGLPLPPLVTDIVRYHQERWDGSGYPSGLRGEKIPLIARAFAVADVYDALTSARPYRPALSHAEAVDYILSRSGLQFDPHVCEVFREWTRTGAPATIGP